MTSQEQTTVHGDLLGLRRLVLVPCHGVCRQGKTGVQDAERDSSWCGIVPAEGHRHVEHIRAGVSIAASAMDCLLVFSGGQTSKAAGPRSEALSYFEIARDAQWWGCAEVGQRCALEEYARDSLENLLFSLALYFERTGSAPDGILVIGWKFKKHRFNLHRRALDWPVERFNYVGVNDPAGDDLAIAIAGEQRKVQSAERDPLLAGVEWQLQRQRRNPFQRDPPYRGMSTKVDALLKRRDALLAAGQRAGHN